MPTRLLPLLPSLLRHLGVVSNLDALEAFFQEQQWENPKWLRQVHGTDAYPIEVPAQGLDLMIQCINPQAPENEHVWGVQSMTFHTLYSDGSSHWKRDWPTGIYPQRINAGELVSLLAEDNDDGVLLTENMACFEIPSVHDHQRWLVMGLFDRSSKKLLTFSLIRNSDWITTV